jgi:hypothetical protein
MCATDSMHMFVHVSGADTIYRSICSNTDISVHSCHLQMERGVLYHTNINDKMLLGQNNHLSW